MIVDVAGGCCWRGQETARGLRRRIAERLPAAPATVWRRARGFGLRVVPHRRSARTRRPQLPPFAALLRCAKKGGSERRIEAGPRNARLGGVGAARAAERVAVNEALRPTWATVGGKPGEDPAAADPLMPPSARGGAVCARAHTRCASLRWREGRHGALRPGGGSLAGLPLTRSVKVRQLSVATLWAGTWQATECPQWLRPNAGDDLGDELARLEVSGAKSLGVGEDPGVRAGHARPCRTRSRWASVFLSLPAG